MRNRAPSIVLVLAIVAALICPIPSTYAVIVNGENAIDLLGQFSTPPQGTDTTPAWTTGCVNNGASPYGFFNNGGGTPVKVVLDPVNHWLFASDSGNNRILAFPLNSSTNLLASKTPSYVFGPSTFTDCTRYNYIYPLGLAVDPVNHLLYQANLQGGPCGVNVYSTSPMTSGAAPLYVLAGGGCSTTQALSKNPVAVALDTTNYLLYVSDPQNNRIMVFPAYGNASWAGSGENALYEIGQPSGSTAFTSSSSGTTQSTLNNPEGLAYDGTNQLLYVVDNYNARVMVFPAYGNASWAGNGENALYELGQTSFTNGGCNYGGSVTASTLCGPEDVVADPADNLVYVSDTSNNRILAYAISGLSSSGESASFVLGAANFWYGHNGSINGGVYSSQSQMDSPSGLAYDSTNKLLYVNDGDDSRIMIFNVSSWPTGQFSAVTQSGQDACGIGTSGALYCWGYNQDGEDGTGVTNQGGSGYSAPEQTGSATNWTAVSQGNYYFDYDACGIAGGALYCWGQNTYGELGLGNTTAYYSPQQVGSATNWIAVTTSGADTCGIRGSSGSGALYCWGANTYGEVGNGGTAGFKTNTAFVTSTTYTGSINGANGIAGANTACSTRATATGSLAPAGTYLAWITTTTALSPSSISTFSGDTLPYVDVDGNVVASNWAQLISGNFLSYGLQYSELGGTALTGSAWTNVSSTGTASTSSASSTTKNCAGWTNATGSDKGDVGTIGSNSSTWTVATPTVTCSTAEHLYCFEQNSGSNEITTPTQIGSATNWTAISQGGPNTCGIAGGKLYCWGRNEFGELGLGNTTEYTTPQQVGSATNWIAISQGAYDTCGIKGSGGQGALYCWGQNYDGEDGVGSTSQVTTPTQVGTATNWTAISVQADDSGDPDACGISGGTLYCWGHNGQGEDGLGNTTQYTTPQPVGSLTTWTAVSYGADSTCGIAGSQLYCWGNNNNGSDGLGTYTQPITTPQLVSIFDLSVENATDEIGQYASQTSTATVNWTQNSPQNGANALGFWGVAGVTMDPVNHHLFVGDFLNNRILVYNLNTDNSIPTTSGGHTAANVLGALSGFPTPLINTSYGGNCNGATFNQLSDLAYDTVNNRLFVVSSTGSQVMVYDNMSTITNNMAASYAVAATSLFNCGFGGSTTQSTTGTPIGIAFDAVNERLFVVDNGWTNSGQGNRILVFNVAPGTIASGENASYVLGQTNYTNNSCNKGGANPTQSSLCSPTYAAFDPVNERLFVADTGNNRIMVFNVAPGTIASNENASYVLGASNFTTVGSYGCNQSSTGAPQGLAYDATNSRLFVYQGDCANVMVFNVGPGVIKNGENASFELGQTNFTNGNSGMTQKSFGNNLNLSGGPNLYYDPGSQRLFLTDDGSNRVLIFDVSPISTNTQSFFIPGYN